MIDSQPYAHRCLRYCRWVLPEAVSTCRRRDMTKVRAGRGQDGQRSGLGQPRRPMRTEEPGTEVPEHSDHERGQAVLDHANATLADFKWCDMLTRSSAFHLAWPCSSINAVAKPSSWIMCSRHWIRLNLPHRLRHHQAVPAERQSNNSKTYSRAQPRHQVSSPPPPPLRLNPNVHTIHST